MQTQCMHILAMRNEMKTLHVSACHAKTKENKKKMWHSVCLVLHLMIWLSVEYYQDWYYEVGGGGASEVLRVDLSSITDRTFTIKTFLLAIIAGVTKSSATEN